MHFVHLARFKVPNNDETELVASGDKRMVLADRHANNHIAKLLTIQLSQDKFVVLLLWLFLVGVWILVLVFFLEVVLLVLLLVKYSDLVIPGGCNDQSCFRSIRVLLLHINAGVFNFRTEPVDHLNCIYFLVLIFT